MNIAHTLKLAARALSRSRGLAALAVVTLGLGIGATTFMFSVVHGALYRGLPFPDGDRIMRVWATNQVEGWDRSSMDYLDYLELTAEQTSFEELAADHSGTINLSTGDRAIRLDGAFVTGNAFSVLRVRPALGRGLLPADDAPGAAPVILLSDRTWRNEFGGDPAILDRAVRVNGEAATVVGIMPAGFHYPELQDAWVTMRRSGTEERGSGAANVVPFGRIRDGVSLEAAQAELSALASRLAGEFPETNRDMGVNVVSFTDMGRETRAVLFTMLGAVGLILLVACTNVANLLLARTATRSREIAVRTALGAGRGRLIGQLIAEAGVLAAAGALLGTVGAWVAMGYFRDAIANTDPPFWFVFTIDAPILVFVVLITAVAAILSGVIPGIKATGSEIQVILQDDSRGSSSMRIGRLSRGLVVAEIALSLGLLVVAGLMARGIIERRNLELPFPTESVFTARIGLFESEYPGAQSRQAFYDDLLRDLRADPAIAAASLTNSLPGTGAMNSRLAIRGVEYAEERDQPRARLAMVSPGFFDTFEAGVVRGRVIDERDTRSSLPVAVINESLAAELFAGTDPIGRQLRTGAIGQGGPEEDGSPWRTIIGVAPDLVMEGVNSEPGSIRRGLYVPLAQEDTRFVSIAARPVAAAAAGAMTLTPAVREAVQRLSPDTPLYWVWTLQETIDRNLWTVDVFGGMMIIFGLIALVMAVAGLYGVTAFSAGRRTHEVGIRMALGAATGDVLGLIMKQSGLQIALGLVLGLGLAVALAMGMQQVLFRVDPMDPVVYLVITTLLTTTALAASAIPALRACRVDPARALRRD